MPAAGKHLHGRVSCHHACELPRRTWLATAEVRVLDQMVLWSDLVRLPRRAALACCQSCNSQQPDFVCFIARVGSLAPLAAAFSAIPP